MGCMVPPARLGRARSIWTAGVGSEGQSNGQRGDNKALVGAEHRYGQTSLTDAMPRFRGLAE
jgi:hypothetical protein